ncbi:(+)-neomenthol dehydrogenase-like [Gossypium australe]|uniref:(+)-neomenthol dehydrogenase-like n=1 Tax=Gossypium australe TaxID=47621 RepID=A0A5B6VVH1_9ROSI|nr:(+)-neomenthol dehydrogenase-like [Gossypium australe]
MCYAFGNFDESTNLHDIKFKYSAFTWQRGGVLERPDRAICNDAWISKFSSSSKTHLPMLKSDYRPLFLSLRILGILTKEFSTMRSRFRSRRPGVIGLSWETEIPSSSSTKKT